MGKTDYPPTMRAVYAESDKQESITKPVIPPETQEDLAMEIRVGKVSHFYDRISVAVLKLSGDIQVGDKIHIQGPMTEIAQRIGSMEIEHQKIQSASAGAEVAIKVIEPVREGDIIYKVAED